MKGVIFSSWKGEVVDNRRKTGKKTAAPAQLKLPAEFKPGVPIQAFMGWNGFAIRAQKVSVVDMCRAYMEAVQAISCGKCFPCRVGTKVIAETLARIAEGKGRLKDLDQMEALGRSILEGSKCQVGQTGPVPLLAALQHYRQSRRASCRERG